jgi:ATP-dependent RNA helicase DeaD
MDKDRSLVRIIEIENPLPPSSLQHPGRGPLCHRCFAAVCYDADELTLICRKARGNTFSCGCAKALFVSCRHDVAARGIDIPELSHVILYEPPDESEAYIIAPDVPAGLELPGLRFLVNTVEKFTLDRIGNALASICMKDLADRRRRANRCCRTGVRST